jgi:cytochrome c-type biogenesis protein CcmH
VTDAGGDRRLARRAVTVAALAAMPAAAALYLLLGNPRAIDPAHSVDLPTAVATVAVDDLRDDLAANLARNPRDARGWIALARLELAQDRFAQAAHAYAQGLAASPQAAKDPGLWCEYADALGMAQGGSLAGRPRALVMEALARDPAHPRALEMAGSSAFEERDYAAAATYWRALHAQLAAGSPEARELSGAIARAGLLADAASSQGELLYSTHCVACHTREVHWRDRKLAKDWATLVTEVGRWQRNGGLGWPEEDVEAVARYLNATIYRFPQGSPKAAG